MKSAYVKQQRLQPPTGGSKLLIKKSDQNNCQNINNSSRHYHANASSGSSLNTEPDEIFSDALDSQPSSAKHHHEQVDHKHTHKQVMKYPSSEASEHDDSTSSDVDVSNHSDEDNINTIKQRQRSLLLCDQKALGGHESTTRQRDWSRCGHNDSDESHQEETRKMEESLDYTITILKLALNNQFDKALAMCHDRADNDLYAALGQAALCFLRASLTLESDDLVAAIQAINNSMEVSSSQRKSMISRLWWRPNYDLFSDVQIHAELVHAESLLMMALITFLADQSLICLVKGAFRIRSCYQTYKECMFILRNRQNWSSRLAEKHFESGVRMGLGTFNLLMSYLPSRVLKFLEYVGFSGNRQIGVRQLDRSIQLSDGLRSVFSSLVTLTYHTYIEAIFGLGAFDANKVKQINNESMELYPNSAFFLLFRGRYHQFQGDLDEALKNFQQCIDAQNDWKQFHSICHWEMMWCYAIRMDWTNAAHYSNLLRRQSKWSPASYTYQHATFLYTQCVERQRLSQTDNDKSVDAKEMDKNMSDIVELMTSVPKLRIRYAGKTIPAEKFAITRSDKFIKQRNRLTLPAMEFLYIWNIFTTMRHLPNQVKNILDKLNEELIVVRNVDKLINMDDYGLVLLLKSMCLKILDRLDEAEECLLEIIDNESQINIDTFILPYACLEIGLLKLNQFKYDEARRWLQKAKHDYTGYLMETVVHFRIHAANQVIQQERHNKQQDEPISGILTKSFSSTDDEIASD